jgi:heat shock protein HtpX
MDWSRDRELGIRMALTLVLLGIVTVVLIGTLYGVLVALAWIAVSFDLFPEASSDLFPADTSWVIGFVAAAIVIGAILYFEFPGETPASRGLTVQSAKNEEYPELYGTIERLAQQADLPVPSVVVADTTVPNAYTSGLSSKRATIVVTTGLLEELEEREVQAVLAHELAHVKNRDAAVMTVTSVPLVIARTIHEWADEHWARLAKNSNSEPELSEIIAVPPTMACFAIAGMLWFIGRLLVRLLSRYRELAADRGAIALTGSPAALASALETVDTGIESLPDRDLRAMSGPSEAFAVVPVETDASNGPVRLGPEGKRRPALFKYSHTFRTRIAPLFDTHPSMETRLERLRDIEKEI